MRLHLAFDIDGNIQGEGVDDVARFVIAGRFDCRTSGAHWTKTYVGRHSVEYSGIYCQRTICGDWTLLRLTGGFWIWPNSLAQSESAHQQNELELPLAVA
jgi:hypothetical protein